MENVILFDLDGTLIDSTDAIVSTFHHSFKTMNYEFTGIDEDIKSLIGYPLEIMYMELGIEKELAWDYVAAYKERYKVISTKKTLLLEKAKEALELASQFARLSVVTTKTGAYTIPLLEHFDILKYFEVITGREHVENPKPHPEPILKTLNQMNIQKGSNVWMVGDTHLDLISANGAEINCVGVLCGYGKEEDLCELTSHITANSFEAVELIQKYTLKT
ncbi:HAD family hydrolase [Arcobacter sp.]|uniref:HAD family hydrolase n=1 Tax=Arcobacter sp. TaxID=1872629 RepID=UPI003C737B56